MPRLASLPNTQKGRQLFEKLGSPKAVVAPMVDQSELAWRKLCRQHGANLCYSPMYHARLFGTSESYREQNLCEEDGLESSDRPLIIQFCANKPDELVVAARKVIGKCDAIDLNLGCPQGIARKGHYGAFLMEDWDLVASLIRAVSVEVPEVPITAKIRVFSDREKTLAYARRVLEAGAVWLTVHGRTREMKGQLTGLADWSQIKYLRDNLPEETVIIANGNIIYRRNIEECLKATGADAVMSAETVLCNPSIFDALDKAEFPRVDRILREYFTIARDTGGKASATAMKTHMFKLLRNFFVKETDIRNQLGKIKTGDYDAFDNIVKQVEARTEEIIASNEADIVANGSYVTVPHWRAQPLFRVVDGVSSNGVVHDSAKAEAQQYAKILEIARNKKAKNEVTSQTTQNSEATEAAAPTPKKLKISS